MKQKIKNLYTLSTLGLLFGATMLEKIRLTLFLVDPARPEDIASAMTRIATNSQLRAELVEKGRLRAGHFSWDEMARQYIGVIEGIY